MNAITRAVLQRWYQPGASLHILDAGCGTGGAMVSCLNAWGNVTGLDLSRTALQFASLRCPGALLQGSVAHLPFPASSFDVVTSFDVLYHQAVQDDLAALQELYRVLVPGGRLILRLPAYDWLRGRHDRRVHTARRYTSRQVAALVQGGGLTLELLSHANMLLFPFALAKRLLERFLTRQAKRSDLLATTGPFSPLLAALLKAEAPLVSRLHLPFGLSILAVGRKP